jgi:hypothetical protein
MTASAGNLVREERRKDFAIAGGLALFTGMFLSLFRAVELSPVSLGNAVTAVGVPDPSVSLLSASPPVHTDPATVLHTIVQLFGL